MASNLCFRWMDPTKSIRIPKTRLRSSYNQVIWIGLFNPNQYYWKLAESNIAEGSWQLSDRRRTRGLDRAHGSVHKVVPSFLTLNTRQWFARGESSSPSEALTTTQSLLPLSSRNRPKWAVIFTSWSSSRKRPGGCQWMNWGKYASQAVPVQWHTHWELLHFQIL